MINRYLGVFAKGEIAYLFTHVKHEKEDHYFVDSSKNGFKFEGVRKNLFINREDGTIEKISKSSDFRISPLDHNEAALFYKSKVGKSQLFFSKSKNLTHFIGSKKVSAFNETAMLIPDFKYQGKYAAIFGEKELKIAYTDNFSDWEISKDPILTLRNDNFDSDSIIVSDLKSTPEGIFLVYFSRKESTRKWYMGTALFDNENPEKLIYRCGEPLWEEDLSHLNEEISPLGSIILEERLIIYFQTKKGQLYAFSLKFFKQSPAFSKAFPPYLVKKFKDNPIISPLLHHFWESKATFNPAAIFTGDKVHILYRAVGDSNTSVLGYATSPDGLNIDSRSPDPAYVPREDFERSNPSEIVFPFPYTSGGGGNGGCEDPKLVEIEGKIYMTYVAFSGRSNPGVALTSIKKYDFLAKNWKWEKPVLISNPKEIHKNWVLFPEKIDGKFAILHHMLPSVSISYFDDLSYFDGNNYLESWSRENHWGKTYFWDSHIRGAGPPPLKTKLGWLLLYQAMDYRDYGKYKLGAMILDSKNPENIIYRSRTPVLEPDRDYENEGYKAGVVYSCGAIIKNKDLLIYYGGADKYTCVAKSNLNDFLEEVKRAEVPHFSKIKLYSS